MHLIELIVLASFTVTLQFPAQLHENDESRIFGGRFAKQGEFPWMVFLVIEEPDDMESACGAFIISKNHVLTAAHCVCRNSKQSDYCSISDIVGKIGHVNEEQATKVKFSKLYVHHGYDDDDDVNDIAVLKLETPLMEFNENVQPICLPKAGKTFPNMQKVVQMGWGKFDNGSVDTSPTLKTTSRGYILDNSSCQTEMNTRIKLGQICVSNLKGAKICGGDSGGPLCIINNNNKLAIGIVSSDRFDFCVAGNNLPTIYTEISYFTDWIIKVTKDTNICWID